MRERSKGGQPNNVNAVTHGRYSRAKRAERLAEAAERRSAEAAWAALVPPIDYGAIVAGIRTTKEAFASLPRGFDGIVAAIKAGKDDG